MNCVSLTYQSYLHYTIIKIVFELYTLSDEGSIQPINNPTLLIIYPVAKDFKNTPDIWHRKVPLAPRWHYFWALLKAWLPGRSHHAECLLMYHSLFWTDAKFHYSYLECNSLFFLILMFLSVLSTYKLYLPFGFSEISIIKWQSR